MPPRVKKTPARAAKSSRKKQIPPEEKIGEAEVEVSVSVSVAEVKEEIKVVEEVAQQKEKKLKPSEPQVESPSKPQVESKSEPNGSLPAKEEGGVNDAFDDDGKGERLELDDNDVEYEPEEEAGGDYYEVEIENEAGQEGDEGEEVEGDEADVGEEDVDMVDEEMEGDGDEGEEDAENAEEHDDIVEEEEHHEVVKERRKRKEFEVFVGGLDKDASEADLRKVFSAVGEVTEVRLMMNPQTRKNKGFAFLRFATVEQAKRAVSELKNPVVKGKQCGVTPSQDNDTLFLGNICKTWTKEALKEKLKHYGVEKVEDLTLVEDTSNKGLNRGFAFLEFSSRNDAMNAFKCLTKRDVVFGVDRTAKVSFADSFVEPDDEIMAKVKTVFVDGLPASWDEDRVKALLQKFGEIENIDLARNMPSAKRKDFGFVTFDTHDTAVACAAGINNAELGEGAKKVKVRARLSRPLQRGRVRRGVQEDHRFGRGISRGGRGSWVHAPMRRIPGQSSSGLRGYGAPSAARGFKRPFLGRDRRPIVAVPERARHLPPPARSYNQRPPGPSYPKSSSKREFSRRGEVTPRSRAAVGYGSRIAAERRSSYRDEVYPSRGSGYSDVAPRSASRTAATAYVEQGYGQRIERVPPTYREGRGHDYDSLSGSKRPYSALDEAPSRYAEAPSRYADAPSRYSDASVRGSRAHLDYGYSGTASQYGDAYSERLGRSHIGYGGRSSYTGEESSGLYSSRHGMGYGGSVSSSDVGGMYSSSYGSDYLSRGPDVGGSSYSSLYSDRGLSGSGYLGSTGSGSYY